MKNILIAIFLIALQAYYLSVNAQIGVDKFAENTNNNSAISFAKELEKIKQDKQTIELNSKDQEALCYKKFAVSNCLKEAKVVTQTAINQVKKRELAIKEQQRSIKTEEAEKKKANVAANLSDQGGGGAQSQESRSRESKKQALPAKSANLTKSDIEISAEKLLNEKRRSETAQKRAANSNRKMAESQQKAQRRTNKNSQANSNMVKYNQKVQQAQEHKMALEKATQERKKPQSASLPIPAAITP